MILNCIGVVENEKYKPLSKPSKAIFVFNNVALFLEHKKGTEIYLVGETDSFIVSNTIEEINKEQ